MASVPWFLYPKGDSFKSSYQGSLNSTTSGPVPPEINSVSIVVVLAGFIKRHLDH